MNKDRLIAWIQKTYNVEPEYLWRKYPNYAVFRHGHNGKWFALVMDVEKSKLGLAGTGKVDILDVKEDPGLIIEMVKHSGFYPAYHMNKENWISVALDGTIDDDKIASMVKTSYALTSK
ncbi:MmcQ/YjbR family DNA-binding protein [Adlercreutzia sp. ZJ154]|uniref:MmcQ/YjbR family DNA-binding protein n=1 Tax=Adlercreutzia sp. ZJ154 TaxID=2709790 RepID=UPI0013EAE451|nr:MmcQ/YjbR family DNA-binding protein [Adlercreutzia sp. ZJ154]